MQSELSPMNVSWPTAPLKSITAKIRSGATPKGGSGSYLDKRDRYALVRSQNVLDHSFTVEGLANISDSQASELRGAELQHDDVLLNITGDGVLRPALISSHRPALSEGEHCGMSQSNFGGTRTQDNAGRLGVQWASMTPRTTPPVVCAGGVYGR